MNSIPTIGLLFILFITLFLVFFLGYDYYLHTSPAAIDAAIERLNTP